MKMRMIVAVFLVATGAGAAEVPQLRQGMSYTDARAALLARGWQANVENPMHKEELQQALQAWFISKGFHEVVHCYPTGLGTCTAVFHDERGRQFYVFTGEPPDENEKDVSATVASWCLGRRDVNCRRGRR